MKELKQLIRQTFLAILMLMAYSSTLYAQDITVSGNVKDANAEPLIGATVIVKGHSSMGTVTDFDGNFTLKVPSEAATLVFSYVGMTTQEKVVGKQRVFNIVLNDNSLLEEVVVVGTHTYKVLGAYPLIKLHQCFRVPALGFPQFHDVLVSELGRMAVGGHVVLVLP